VHEFTNSYFWYTLLPLVGIFVSNAVEARKPVPAYSLKERRMMGTAASVGLLAAVVHAATGVYVVREICAGTILLLQVALGLEIGHGLRMIRKTRGAAEDDSTGRS